MWLCPRCNNIYYKMDFKINRIDDDIELAILNFEKHLLNLKCSNCENSFNLEDFFFDRIRLPGD